MHFFLSLLATMSFVALGENLEFKAAEIKKLEIHNSMGNVHIAPTLNKTAGVVIQKKKWGERCKLDINLENGVLKVISDDQYWVLDHECRADFILSVPKQSDAILRVGIGDLEVTGLQGSLEAKVGSGNAVIKGTYPELKVLTGNGDIRFEGLCSKMSVRSGRGNVEILYPENPKEALLQVDLGRGDMTIRAPGTARVLSETTTGNGIVRNDFQQEKYSHQLKIEAKAGSGDIQIMRQ